MMSCAKIEEYADTEHAVEYTAKMVIQQAFNTTFTSEIFTSFIPQQE